MTFAPVPIRPYTDVGVEGPLGACSGGLHAGRLYQRVRCLSCQGEEMVACVRVPHSASPVFGDVPTGSRDLYWCWHLNEPVIISYRDGLSYCDNCRAELLGDEDSHTFIAHVLKPVS